MYHNRVRNRSRAAALAGGAALLLAGAPARAASITPVNCQRAIWKASAKLEQDTMKALQKCEDSKLKGKLPSATDCTTDATAAAAITKAQGAMQTAINKACSGLSPADFKFGSVCPDLPNAGCNTAITDLASVITCMTCVANGGVNLLSDLYYASLTAPGGDKSLETCKQTIGKEAATFFKAKSSALQKCQDKMINSALGGPCPDGAARAAIQKASDKAVAKITAKCGGFSTAQIGAPAACPSVETQGTGIECGGTIASTTDLVDCVACATEFLSLCTDCSHCGNGVNNPVTGLPVVDFSVGETCDDGNFVDNDGCPETCEIRSCVGFAGTTQKVDVSFTGTNVSGLTVFLRYGENAARLPGRGNEQTVVDRVTGLPANAFTAVNDLDYALRVVAIGDGALAAGKLFTVEFDLCKKPKFKLTDLECVVEDASDPNFNPVAGVTCQAAFVK
jgi:cysteine-rich repeat protein